MSTDPEQLHLVQEAVDAMEDLVENLNWEC